MLDRKWATALAGAVGGMLLLAAMAPVAYAQVEPVSAATTTVVVPEFIEITLNVTAINFGTVNPGSNSTRQALQMNITDNSNVDVNFTFRPTANMSLNPSNIINWSGVNVSANPDVFWYNLSFDNAVDAPNFGGYAFHPEGAAFNTYTGNLTGFFDRPFPGAGSNTSTDFHLWAHSPRGLSAGTYNNPSGSFDIRASRCVTNC